MSSKTREFFESLKNDDRPSLGAELKAMAREAVKDIRSTAMETFFGSPEQSTEPGVPLNPTQYEVTQERAGQEALTPEAMEVSKDWMFDNGVKPQQPEQGLDNVLNAKAEKAKEGAEQEQERGGMER